jgi:hypothetical protein
MTTTVVRSIGTAAPILSTGTITASGTAAVVGSGTLFKSELIKSNGYFENIQVGGTIYNVIAIADDTHLTLDVAATFSAVAFNRRARHYSGIQTWKDASPTDLTVADQIWKGEMYNDSEFLNVGSNSMSGVTSDANRYLWLTAAPGESFVDNQTSTPGVYDISKGVGMQSTGSYRTMLTGGNGYGGTSTNFKLTRLQFYNNTGYSSDYYIPITLGSAAVVDSVLFMTQQNSNRGFINDGHTTNSTFVSLGAGNHTLLALGGGVAHNVTCIRPIDAITSSIALDQGSKFTNCAVIGPFTGNGWSRPIDVGSSNNATSSATAPPGTSGISNLVPEAQFAGVLSGSLNTTPIAGNGLVAGIRDQTYTADKDMYGIARSITTPTIGSREYVSKVVPTPTDSSTTKEIVSKRVRYSQSKQASPINWDNPITSGMLLLINPAVGLVNMVTGGRLTSSSGPMVRVYDKQNLCWSWVRGTPNYITTDVRVPSVGDQSAFAIVRHTSLNAGADEVYLTTRVSSNNGFEFASGAAAGTTPNQTFSMRYTQGSDADYTGGSAIAGGNTNFVPIGFSSRNNATVTFYGYGKPTGSSVTHSMIQTSDPIVVAGLPFFSEAYANYDMPMIAYWNRKLTDAEHASLADNPNQLYI